MKKRFFIFFSVLFLFPLLSYALDIPPAPAARVNDTAGLLDDSSESELEAKLKGFEDVTTNQIVVVTFPSLEGESLEDFSLRLAEQWKIGQKGKDNGAVLLIFKNDRQLRIEVGYGLEGALPDATAKSIIQNEIVPHFKEGDFKGGIFAGVDAMMAATKGEYKPAPSQERKESKGAWDWIAETIGVIIVGFIFYIFIPLILLLGSYEILIRPILRLFWPRKFPRRRESASTGGSSGWSSRRSWGGSSSSLGRSSFSGGGGSFGGGGASGRW